MTERLHLTVCEHYRSDVEAALASLGISNVRLSRFPGGCGRPPLSWDHLKPELTDPGERHLILGGCCLEPLDIPPEVRPHVKVHRLQTCQELLLSSQELNPLLDQGAYILTRGWLSEWRKHLEAIGGDAECQRNLWRESATRLVCLETDAPCPASELAALEDAVGLPVDVRLVGHTHLKTVLASLLSEEPDVSIPTPSDRELADARQQAADRAMALEFLGELSQSLPESEVIRRMEAFFSMLFGASRAVFEPCPAGSAGWPAGEDFQQEPDGFTVRVGRDHQQVGLLRISGLAFPRYASHYLNLMLSLSGVCALAILNTRAYCALEESQASQRLMLEVLDTFYHPEGDLGEVDIALSQIQRFTQVDAIGIRYVDDRMEVQLRGHGYSEQHLQQESRFGLRDPSGQLVLRSDGTPVLPCLCGNLLTGHLPETCGRRTVRGSFWTGDLPGLLPELQRCPPQGGICGHCLREGYRSLVMVPLRSKHGTLGLLQLHFRKADGLTPPLLDLLEGLAGSMALGLERRWAEDRLRRMNQELEQRVLVRTQELEDANTSLRREMAQRCEAEEEKERMERQLLQAQKLEAIGTLAGGIAHDFNNILTPILSYSELGLMRSQEEGPMRHSFEMIQKASQRAKELVSQILTFSRRQEITVAPVMLSPVLNECMKLLRASLPATIEIRAQVRVEDLWVLADPIHMQQILMNLCTNAFHAMESSGGVLEVSLERLILQPGDHLASMDLSPGRWAVLQVSDTGCGMPPEVLGRVFEPFFTTKGPGRGTGLGLSVVHGLVQSHHGQITVYSEPGQGTLFRIYLPEHVPNQLPQDTASTPEPLPGGHERVLVVDDDEATLDATAALLEHLGYQVTRKGCPVEALAQLQNNPGAFDLVVSDLTLPRMNGLELAKAIREMIPDLPVILGSGYSASMDAERMASAPIQGFMQKPYSASRMAQVVRKALETPRR